MGKAVKISLTKINQEIKMGKTKKIKIGKGLLRPLVNVSGQIIVYSPCPCPTPILAPSALCFSDGVFSLLLNSLRVDITPIQ